MKLEKDKIRQLVPSIQQYFREELEMELDEMRAGFLLEYFAKEAGPLFYNRGVKDAEGFFRERLEDLGGTCFEPEMTYWLEKKR